ncbi:MAG: DUF1203 domain-containing protein [Parvularculaceae bacterium]|nr:DUF1203 domain-containing protein [Parvularculaceae bacterium]
MSFVIAGLDPARFAPLVGLPDADLAARGVVRRTAHSKPGFPCRVSLEDAEPGETLLLLNFESHSAPTPYRSAYAIYVRESAAQAATFHDQIPPVMRSRPMAFRHFDKNGMLIGASLALKGDSKEAIIAAFENQEVAYLHAHNAAHGCFAAEVRRG